MKTGFELLKTRYIENKIDLDEIEAKYQLSFPPMYRLFAESFILGDNCLFTDEYEIDTSQYPRHCNFFTYIPDEEVRFAGFNSPEKSMKISLELDELAEKKYLAIGYCGFNGGIACGTHGLDTDKIYLYDADETEEFRLLSNNIFEFVRGLKLIPIEENEFLNKINFSMLYKKWNDKYWRVK